MNDQPTLGIGPPRHRDNNPKGMTMNPRIRMPRWHSGHVMRGFKCKTLRQFKHARTLPDFLPRVKTRFFSFLVLKGAIYEKSFEIERLFDAILHEFSLQGHDKKILDASSRMRYK
jgi:hypothetical protein